MAGLILGKYKCWKIITYVRYSTGWRKFVGNIILQNFGVYGLVIDYTVHKGTIIHNGLGHAVGWSLGVLYADDGLLGSWYPEQLQCGLFNHIGLMTNAAKSKTMACQPG